MTIKKCIGKICKDYSNQFGSMNNSCFYYDCGRCFKLKLEG